MVCILRDSNILSDKIVTDLKLLAWAEIPKVRKHPTNISKE